MHRLSLLAAPHGVLHEDQTNAPVADARVTAWRADGHAAEVVAATASDGTFELPLGPGAYVLDAAGAGRVGVGEGHVTVAALAPAPVELRVTRPARFAYGIRSGGAASPGKLTFRDAGNGSSCG